ncbi:MAG: hypothetical protein JW809_19360 [Pirellulales bacterium]|nr:hypothetical protein [Pirellulales bacterium]
MVTTTTVRLTDRWTPFRPHPAQRALCECLYTRAAGNVLIVAGRGSGKTEIVKRWLVSRLPEPKPWPDPRYFYGAPTLGQAKRIAWRDFLDLIPAWWIDGGKHGRNVSTAELTIRTIFGSTLHVVGLQEAKRIEGVQWDAGAVDESSDVKPGTYDISIAPALTWRNGICVRFGVPKRHGVGAFEFRTAFERGRSGQDPDFRSFWWESEGVVPQAALERARRALDPKDYREQFKASWETAGGIVFHAFDRQRNVRPCAYHADRPLVVGCDFNVDPMAWVVGHRYDNRMEWIDELWLRDTNTEEAAGVLADRYADHQGGLLFFGDASGAARKTSASKSDYAILAGHPKIKRLRPRLCIPKINPIVADRLAACNAMFHNAAGETRMYVAPHCVQLIADLERRGFKQGTTELDDSGDIGHITDALGYAVHRLFPIRLALDGKVGVIVRKGTPSWHYQ